MKISFTADVQAHARSAFATYDGWLNSRLKDISDSLLFAADQACGGDFVINGDLFHNRETIGIDVIHVVVETISKCAARCSSVVISAGNHDQYKRDGSVSPLVMLSRIKGVHVVPRDGTSLTLGGNQRVHLLPHTVDHEKVRDFVRSVSGGVLVLHQGVAGAMLNGIISTSSLTLQDLQPDRFDFVVLGDYHKPQKLAKNVWYVGSPVQHDWGEAGDEKRILVLDTDRQEMKSVPTEAPEFRNASVSDWLNHLDRDSHFYRIAATPAERVLLPPELPPNVVVVPVVESSAEQPEVGSYDLPSHIKSWLDGKNCGHLLAKAMGRLAA
jgi:DNA repair exonuclease SbcCD nuclease subunit